MIQRTLNGVLLLIALAGIYYTWQTRSELGRVRAEYDTLANEFGSLEVRNPEKFYVRRIKTEEPYDFAWRFYHPDQVALQTRASSLSGSSSSSRSQSPAHQGIVRVRFRFSESGLGVFITRNHGSSTFGMGNVAFAEFLQSRWDELRIEAIGEGEPHESDINEVMTFLTVRIPESLVKEAKASLGNAYRDIPENNIFVLQIGTPKAFHKAEESDGPE